MNTKELDKKYVANTYNRFPLEIVSGKGAVLYDENGKEYIDMGAGIAVNTFGMADDGWVDGYTAITLDTKYTEYLKKGKNVIAVSVNQHTGGCYFDMGLSYIEGVMPCFQTLMG